MNDRLEPLMHRRVIRMKLEKITLKFAQIFIFIFVTFSA